MSQKKAKEIHVLLVGRDPHLIKAEKSCLEQQGGLHVETALLSDDASAILGEIKPEVIIVDWPWNRAGSELVGALRSKGDMTPIIIFSYDNTKQLLAELCKSGTIDFIDKSGDPETVYPNLKSYIVTIITHDRV
jgi:DNA-binding NtrC family response regulator